MCFVLFGHDHDTQGFGYGRHIVSCFHVLGWTRRGTSAILACVKTLERGLMLNIGTILYTWFNGKICGTDEFGNRYFFSKSDKLRGKQRRWVMFKGDVEASKIPPEWHAWLHHTSEVPLTESAAQPKRWQKPHEPNLTGTVGAYRPSGHDVLGGQHAPSSGDYEPWSPS